MEIRTLKYFLVIAQEENITRAASLLHVTQPTLSRQMAQLENELGVELFRRSQHRIYLTEKGLLLKRRAEEMVEMEEKTMREMSEDEEVSGTLNIGSGDLRSMTYLANALAKFKKLYPGVVFELYSGNSDDIKERIEQGRLDMGILLEPVDFSRYEIIHLPVEEEWCIEVPSDSELAQKDAVQPKDLVNADMILSHRARIMDVLQKWFGRYYKTIHVSGGGNLPHNSTQLVKSGLGYSINVRLDVHYDGVVFKPLDPPITSTTVLVYKKTEASSKLMKTFIEFIQKYTEENQ